MASATHALRYWKVPQDRIQRSSQRVHLNEHRTRPVRFVSERPWLTQSVCRIRPYGAHTDPRQLPADQQAAYTAYSRTSQLCVSQGTGNTNIRRKQYTIQQEEERPHP